MKKNMKNVDKLSKESKNLLSVIFSESGLLDYMCKTDQSYKTVNEILLDEYNFSCNNDRIDIRKIIRKSEIIRFTSVMQVTEKLLSKLLLEFYILKSKDVYDVHMLKNALIKHERAQLEKQELQECSSNNSLKKGS